MHNMIHKVEKKFYWLYKIFLRILVLSSAALSVVTGHVCTLSEESHFESLCYIFHEIRSLDYSFLSPGHVPYIPGILIWVDLAHLNACDCCLWESIAFFLYNPFDL